MESKESTQQRRGREKIDEFIDILACPACGGAISREGDELCCNDCSRRYPIVNGIPVMMVEQDPGNQQ